MSICRHRLPLEGKLSLKATDEVSPQRNSSYFNRKRCLSMSTCFFIGHRDAPSSIYPALLEAVERHVAEYGVNEFLVGHYGAFDHMAARAVLEVKKTHPGVRLTLLLPYHPAERSVFLPDGFDGSFYPPDMENVPRRFAIVCANQSALLQYDFLIAFVCRPGNARKLLDCAQALKTVRICRL